MHLDIYLTVHVYFKITYSISPQSRGSIAIGSCVYTEAVDCCCCKLIEISITGLTARPPRNLFHVQELPTPSIECGIRGHDPIFQPIICL